MIKIFGFLFFLTTISSFSQSLKDNTFLKQDVYIRGYLTAKDYNLKGSPKKVINTSYTFNKKDGSKSKIVSYYVKFFSKKGLLTKEETYSSDNPNDKSISNYYYTDIRLDSVSGFRRRNYIYDKQSRLNKIVYYQEDKNDIVNEGTFSYDTNGFINKVSDIANKTNTLYYYNKKGNISLIKYINPSGKTGNTTENLYDINGDVSSIILNDIDYGSYTRINYIRTKDKNNNLTTLQYSNNSNKGKKSTTNSTFEYDSFGSLIKITTYEENKRKYVYESKIVYYTEEELNQKETIEKEPILFLENILEKQLEYGQPSFDNPYKYTSQDFEVIQPEVKKILASNGFKFLNDLEFKERIKTIFGRTIDLNSSSKYLYVNFIEKCNRTPVYFPNNIIDYFGNFIIKNENFITDSYAIPQIIDYQKEFNDLSIKENSLDQYYKDEKGEIVSKNLWKDNKSLEYDRNNNIQTLVARNMYLFNDSKAHFKWLILNDQYFMRSLVTTFGYYDDTALVEWVVENTKMDAQNLEPLNEIIYNKKCDGKIGFNYTFFQIISEDEEKATEKFNFLKWYYFDWLLNPKNTLELTFSQKAEIIARMHSFIYSNMNDYRTYEFMGTFAEHYDYDNTYSKEFKAKNYYNIPDFEKQWKEAKLEGDGITLPGEME
ncbi:hypothetical protein SY27_14465 [Flavobacterium sp. 316]|uniref:hypothetical protein n=1 Tax=Flavobacterium sp. 316 TaxID=1603293 RepID=UPI0005E12C4E|nr:hypothetical protein [Flavobacterium sp. 316]KIX20321.1 hypothetical protein SY27_14465 [Flavobacterium sp. 316]